MHLTTLIACTFLGGLLGAFLGGTSPARADPTPDAAAILASLDDHPWTGNGSYSVPGYGSGHQVAAQADAWWLHGAGAPSSLGSAFR
jgi:hypothetical protein